jgi:hypothetical protein
MRRTLFAAVVAVAAVAIVVAAAGAGGSQKRTPDQRAVPLLDTAQISLLEGIQQVQKKYGAVIEAKYELDDAGALSLSVYPVTKGLHTNAEFNVFEEAAGPPDVPEWKPEIEVFKDQEHLTRSSFDLTVMQVGHISLATAVRRAVARQPGIPYWAVPVIKGTKPGVGVYIKSTDGKTHHVFVPVR